MWFGSGSDVVRAGGCGSEVVQIWYSGSGKWFGCGSDMVRTWFGHGSDMKQADFLSKLALKRKFGWLKRKKSGKLDIIWQYSP